jgi:ribosomal protein L30E
MTRTYTSAIALAFAALFVGQAMAADTPITRDQVQAEMAEAVRTGNIVIGESSAKLNEQFPQLYPQQSATSSVTRAQVQAELAQAVRAGDVALGESGVRLNEVFPHNYASQADVASASREEVKAELTESVRAGLLNKYVEA